MDTISHLVERYQTLEETAQAFGLATEVQTIARRKTELDMPFLLLVAGAQGSGKSTVMDRLAGRPVAPGGASRPWTDYYRRYRGRSPYAVVYRRSEPERGDILSLEQAHLLAEQAARYGTPAIDRIIWYVDAPELPEHVMVAEAPSAPEGEAPRFNGHADAVLYALSVTTLTGATPALPLDIISPRAVPTLGVLTHLERIPQEAWPQMRKASKELLDALDHVVFFTTPSAGRPAQQCSALLREVRMRFYSCASEVRLENHRRFAATMKDGLARSFETYVDRVLTDRWNYHQHLGQCRHTLNGEMGTLKLHLATYLNDLQDWAGLHARQSERGMDAVPAPQPTLPLHVFFRRMEEDLLYRVRQIPSDLQIAASASGEAASTVLKLPAPPLFSLAVLRGDVFLTTESAVAATNYVPDQQHLEHEAKPAQAGLWEPAERWIERLVRRATDELRGWLKAVKASLWTWLKEQAAATFQAAHGIRPDDVPQVLLQKEAYYMRLLDYSLVIRTPHAAQGWTTPVLLLLSAQQNGFIETWNRTLVRSSFRDTVAQAERHLKRQLAQMEMLVQDTWTRSKAAADEKLPALWKQPHLKHLLGDRMDVSFRAVTDMMGDTLAYPGVTGIRHSLRSGGASLFLAQDQGSFLLPPQARTPAPLHDVPARLLKEHVIKEAERLWQADSLIPIPLGLRDTIINGLGGAALLAVTATTWGFFLIDSAGLLAAGLAGVAALLGWGVNRLLGKRMATAAASYTEKVHTSVRDTLAERFRQLESCMGELLKDGAFRARLEALLLQESAQPAAVYLPYGELVRRLASR